MQIRSGASTGSAESPPDESSPAFSYHAFLSHRYKAPEVNLHFFELFSSVGEVQFKVDRGTSRISMTRLHRMVRDADAFIGIYPLPGSVASRPTADELRAASRYFRLELDLAVRSGKPSIVFYDSRYRSTLRVPAGTYQYGYDAQEIAGKGGMPTAGRQLQAIKQFSAVVAASMEYGAVAAATQLVMHDKVGILLPTDDDDGTGVYNADVVRALVELISDCGYECKTLPRAVDADFFNTLHQLDWVVADIGAGHHLSPIVAFLHGQFTPMLLLKFSDPRLSPSPSELERSLFGAFEVGYSEDILVWDQPEQLLQGVRDRLATIEAEIERLNTVEEARAYFISAGRRKERVFLSYSGEDVPRVAGLRESLVRRFQDVFDYKTVGAIAPGSNWIRDLFDTLNKSAIGIICLSEHYLASGTCQHEAAELIAQHDQRRTSVFVVNLDASEPPEYMRYLQYLVPEQHGGDSGLIDAIVNEVGPENES